MTSIEGTQAQLDLFGCSSCHGSCRRSTAKYTIQFVIVYLYRLDYERKTKYEIQPIMITQASLYAEEASNVYGKCAYCMGQQFY